MEDEEKHEENIFANSSDVMYRRMHLLSQRAMAKLPGEIHVHFSDTSSLSSKAQTETIEEQSSFLMKTYKEVFFCELVLDEDLTKTRGHMSEDPLFVKDQGRRLMEWARRLDCSSKELGPSSNVNSIVRYGSKIFIMKKAVNYMPAPPSAVKVQWRLSRFLRAPSFFLVYAMLSKYGTVLALIKLTSNSAVCIYDKMQEANHAVNVHLPNQSSKLLIISWWNESYARASAWMKTPLSASQWLPMVCAGLEDEGLAAEMISSRHSQRPDSSIRRENTSSSVTENQDVADKINFFRTLEYARKTTRAMSDLHLRRKSSMDYMSRHRARRVSNDIQVILASKAEERGHTASNSL